MNRRSFVASLAAAAAAVRAQSPVEADIILQAMADELDRSRRLKIVAADTPYFFSYSLFDGENYSASASLGAMVRSSRTRYRLPRVEVRVGSYEFDNTNYRSGMVFVRNYQMGPYPVDNSYAALRRALWLSTDTAYKAAVEEMSRKRAALKNAAAQEDLPDFAHAEPVKLILPLAPASADEEAWKERLRRLSAIFTEFPAITLSSVSVQSGWSAHYIATSEGTRVRVPENATSVEIRARAYAPDGAVVRDAAVAEALDANRLPPDAELERLAHDVGRNVTALAAAPINEAYTGPVLFEGIAGPQIFAEVLGRNLSSRRRPVGNPGRPVPFIPSELEGRLESPVLPDWMDVVDDPTQDEWHGRPLFGYYRIDLEGVEPKPLTLVEKGVLKAFLLGRRPVKGFAASNGHTRLPGTFCSPGNLFVSASQSLPATALRAKLMQICRERRKPYGIIIRKMDFPSSAAIAEVRRVLAGAIGAGDAHPVSLPLLVFRLYPDGREEIVRGMRFRDFGVRSLKDIVAASDENFLFNYLENGVPFAIMGGANFVAETSVVAPSVLIDEVELDRVQSEYPRPPLVPPPPLT